MSDPLLQDKVAVITGGGAGIGGATAELFSEHGAMVYIADIDGDAARAVSGHITDLGGRATGVTMDARSADDIERLRERVLREHGRVDVLVNNVGHWIAVKDLLQGDATHWQSLYEINLLHVFQMTHTFLPRMLEQGRGSIINVSSIEGVRGYPLDPVYAAFKAAVIHFTRSLGVDVAGRGVRVNGIAPDMTNSAPRTLSSGIPPGVTGGGPTGFR